MRLITEKSFFSFHSVLPNTKTLHITNIVVPPFVDVRDVVMLSCSYNIGTQKLNSVKWYKNEKEFYRWVVLNSRGSWVGGWSYRHILWWMHSGESWERWIYIKSIMQMCVQTLNLMHMQSNLFSLHPFLCARFSCLFILHSKFIPFYLFFAATSP